MLEREKELSIEKKNALKRDKAIQGLTSALKSKENEVGGPSGKKKKIQARYLRIVLEKRGKRICYDVWGDGAEEGVL